MPSMSSDSCTDSLLSVAMSTKILHLAVKAFIIHVVVVSYSESLYLRMLMFDGVCLQKDSHTVYLEQELESLKVVLEIKNNQLHQKEKKIMEMDKLVCINLSVVILT